VIAVFDESDDFGFQREIVSGGTETTFHQFQPIFDCATNHVVFEHFHVMPDVEYAAVDAMRFRDKDATLLIEAKGNGIGEHGFCGKNIRRESRR
jgi:hypothetical protein